MSAERRPFLSVIVPAHQGSRVLRQSLPALLASDLPRDTWELIVVDDASTDDTSLVAAEYADAVIGLAGNPYGPAYARNRGVEASRGEIVVFVDADVCVHPDALRRFASLFLADESVGAAFGSYDAHPPAPGAVSRFRNLLHHHVHQRSRGEAETFWAGCGAVRREAFIGVGMFDEWHFGAPQIEDIELGRRLRRHGHRILLLPEIQCAHLKRWTFRNMVSTDLRGRGTLWMWLMLQEGRTETPQTLNLRRREKLAALLVLAAALTPFIAALMRDPRILLALPIALFGMSLLNASFYWMLLRVHGPLFALTAIPLHAVYYLVAGASVPVGMLMILLFGSPSPALVASANTAMGLETWPPVAKNPPTSVWNTVEQRAMQDATVD